jgi:hypothetical protein
VILRELGDRTRQVQLRDQIISRTLTLLEVHSTVMASVTTLRTTLKGLAAKWPSDPLRPSIQFSTALQSAIDRTTTAQPLTATQLNKMNEMSLSLDRLLSDTALKRVEFLVRLDSTETRLFATQSSH